MHNTRSQRGPRFSRLGFRIRICCGVSFGTVVELYCTMQNFSNMSFSLKDIGIAFAVVTRAVEHLTAMCTMSPRECGVVDMNHEHRQCKIRGPGATITVNLRPEARLGFHGLFLGNNRCTLATLSEDNTQEAVRSIGEGEGSVECPCVMQTAGVHADSVPQQF